MNENGSSMTSMSDIWRLSRADFLAAHTAPFLVQLSYVLGASPEHDPRFGTVSLNQGHVASGPGHRVFSLEKQGRNPFAGMITVGRAANNDVVLASPCVSKFHAFLRRTPRGWVIGDARSSNGTSVEGSRLASGCEHLLDLGRSSIPIGFGTVACQLFSPAGFWDHARAFFGGRVRA